MLGRLIADITGCPYAVAVTRMVLEPLGMHDSWFPARRPESDVVSGHRLADDGSFTPEPARIFTVPAATGSHVGLGWLVNQVKDVCGHAGSGPGAATSPLVRPSTGEVGVAHTNRLVPVEPINARLIA